MHAVYSHLVCLGPTSVFSRGLLERGDSAGEEGYKGSVPVPLPIQACQRSIGDTGRGTVGNGRKARHSCGARSPGWSEANTNTRTWVSLCSCSALALSGTAPLDLAIRPSHSLYLARSLPSSKACTDTHWQTHTGRLTLADAHWQTHTGRHTPTRVQEHSGPRTVGDSIAVLI